MTRHTVTTERRRGFQPPWYAVVIWRCEDGMQTVLRVNWRGGAPCGAIIGNCGHQLRLA